ncbi:hypothetical protein E2C01_011727 [Portunus trituberculatus]|uniref:Uncharacterized protein n=1 Tax=Portunus trituberculatus TaxID=210409 RepID=A0A5B7DC15_PORTR|nr:hypothetical protein [Portunus trituberculatus]
MSKGKVYENEWEKGEPQSWDAVITGEICHSRCEAASGRTARRRSPLHPAAIQVKVAAAAAIFTSTSTNLPLLLLPSPFASSSSNNKQTITPTSLGPALSR